MSRPLIVSLIATAVVGLVSILFPPPRPGPRPGEARPAPEFPSADPRFWINSAPLSMGDLLGQVVVLDVWTYG